MTKTSLDDLLKVPVLGDWMYDTRHKPTMEEIEELMWIVAGDPEEFDFDVEDITERCVKVFKMDKNSLDMIMLEIAIMSEE
jgi:hypothetical protein